MQPALGTRSQFVVAAAVRGRTREARPDARAGKIDRAAAEGKAAARGRPGEKPAGPGPRGSHI